MKKLLSLLLLTGILSPALALDAYFNKAILMSPNEGMYVETQMLFDASSIRFTRSAEGFQAQVELTYIFEQNGAVADFSKNIVRSPFIPDSINALQDFLDVQRFFLAPGEYQLSIKLRDLNNPVDTGSIIQSVVVPTPGKDAFFSDLLFIDTVYQNEGNTTVHSRGSVDMIPRISGFHGPGMQKVKIYTELYQSDFALGEGEAYLVTLDILESNDPNAAPLPSYRALKRLTTKEVEPIFHSWNISKLQTGKYMVRLEARNRNNELMASKLVQLDRYNVMPGADSLDLAELAKTFAGELPPDSLRTMLYCMRYEADQVEERYINQNWETGDTVELRRFFYNFWHDRNQIDPESAWRQYHSEIAFVEENFGLGSRRKHACATDRGRTYLHYGKPNTRFVQRSEPSASPYEIWHYYKVPEKANAKFVFYDPSLVTNDFVMLHSNVPGEQFDHSWYLQLSRPNIAPGGNDELTNTQGNVIDPNNMNAQQMNEVGFRALEFWNNPR